MKKDYIVEILIAFILLLFAYSSVAKFLDHNRFVIQMSRAPLPLIKSIAPLLGWLIPIIEMLVSLGLIINKTRVTALGAAILLLLAFEFYIAGMLLSGLHLPCTCGGIIENLNWKQHLLFNGAVMIIGIMAYRYLIKKKRNAKASIKDLVRAKSR
jgi:hypothetical protein